jgi:CRISPR-associated endonuclease Cas1
VREHHFFPGAEDLPARIVMLDGSGSVSFDVLKWLSQQRIPLVHLDWRGEAIVALAGNGFPVSQYRVEWQRSTRADRAKRMAFCIDLISRKIEATVLVLEKTIRRSADWEKAMQRAYADLTRLECDPPSDITTLRGLEAGCAAAYFRAWRAIPIKWARTAKRPIPPSWLTVGARSSPNRFTRNRNATHPINAMLNYAYAALESDLRIRAIAEGYDPQLGIMHDRKESPSGFIFDMMEPERPKVDQRILEFVKSHTLHPADFTIRSDGVCRLNPEMAKWMTEATRASSY